MKNTHTPRRWSEFNHRLKGSLSVLLLAVASHSAALEVHFEPVNEGVFAFVGDMGPRTPTNEGYLTIGIDGKRYRAHRVAWALANGPMDMTLPPGSSLLTAASRAGVSWAGAACRPVAAWAWVGTPAASVVAGVNTSW